MILVLKKNLNRGKVPQSLGNRKKRKREGYDLDLAQRNLEIPMLRIGIRLWTVMTRIEEIRKERNLVVTVMKALGGRRKGRL